MDDTIYRQQVFDAFNTSAKELVVCGIQNAIMVENYLNRVLKTISCLPPAQSEIIRCKDCKWFNDIGCAIRIVDDTDKPSEEDYCSFAERRQDDPTT